MPGTILTVGKPPVAELRRVAVPETAASLRKVVPLLREAVPEKAAAHEGWLRYGKGHYRRRRRRCGGFTSTWSRHDADSLPSSTFPILLDVQGFWDLLPTVDALSQVTLRCGCSS